MANGPALYWCKFQIDSHYAETRGLTPRQRLAHIDLMLAAWKSADGALPDDDVILARRAGMSSKEWGRSKSTILETWQLQDGRWLHPTSHADRAEALEASAKRAEAGAKGGRSKALKTQGRRLAGPEPGQSAAVAYRDRERDRSSDPKGSAGAVAPRHHRDSPFKGGKSPRKAAFEAGTAHLAAEGVPPKRARSLVAKAVGELGPTRAAAYVAEVASQRVPDGDFVPDAQWADEAAGYFIEGVRLRAGEQGPARVPTEEDYLKLGVSPDRAPSAAAEAAGVAP